MVRGRELHVRHRAQRGEDGDARGGELRRAGRRRRARRAPRASRTSSTTPSPSASRRSASCSASCRSTISTIRPRGRPSDPVDRRDEALLDLIPDSANKPYDMHEVIGRVVDDGAFLEVHRGYADNILVGFARLGGRPVGIVANQPAVLAGVLDINASLKAARFIRFCDCFNLPVVTFVDVPGFLPGRRPGARRDHQARRQAALRLLRGDGAQAHRDHPQGVRRRVRRDELQAHPRRPQPGLADGGDRGDGSQGRGGDSLQGRDRRGRRSRRRHRAADRGVHRASSPIPTPRRPAATSTT